MSQARIDSFFSARKSRSSSIKRKQPPNDSPRIHDAPVSHEAAPSALETQLPSMALSTEPQPQSAPQTPKKFQSPCKELDFSAMDARRTKRARLNQLNHRLEEVLRVQKVKKNENRAKAKENRHQLSASDNAIPKLSRRSLMLEIPAPAKASSVGSPLKKLPLTPTKPPATKIKASPRKWATSEIYLGLADKAKESDLKLPYKYKFLLEVFHNVDQIVSMKFNRQEAIRVTDLKPFVQKAMKRNFTERYLTQIRAVFPQAYRYFWEQMRSKYGQKKDDYELHMTPNLSYREDIECGTQLSDEKRHSELAEKGMLKLSSKDLVARRKIFTGILFTLVYDQHQTFLRQLEAPIDLPYEEITEWHRDFDLESCHDVDMLTFPPKPDVSRFHSAQEVLSASRTLFGTNRRLEQALNEQAERERERAKKEELSSPSSEELLSLSKTKRFQGLPPGVIKRILAKEKATQIKAMTEKPEEKKHKEMLEELQVFGPLVLNCLYIKKQEQCRGAVALKPFAKYVSESHNRGRSEKDTEALIRTLVKMAPDWLQIVSIKKVEYLRNKAGAPDSNALREKLKSLLDEENKA